MDLDTLNTLSSDSETPVAESQATDTVDQSTPPESQAPAEDPTFDIDGVGPVPLSELRKGYLRQQDYTRKTSAVSQKARQFQQWEQEKAQYEQTMGQLRTFLQDRARLKQYLDSLPGEPPQLDPEELLTAKSAQALLTQREAQLQRNFEEKLSETERRLITASYQTQYGEAINNKLRDIGGRMPELRQIPGMEQLLRNAVQSQQPQSIEQALELFEEAAAYYKERFEALVKARVASPNNPLNRGLEPPASGSPRPPAEPEDFNGARDPRLRDLVMKDLERMMAGGRT